MSHEQQKEEKKKKNARPSAPGIFTSLPHTLASRALVSDRRHQRAAGQPLKISHKVALPARLGALRETTVLLDGLPLLRDEVERLRAVLYDAGLDEPAAND